MKEPKKATKEENLRDSDGVSSEMSEAFEKLTCRKIVL